MAQTYFISGIDTDCGKTIATGLIAKHLLDSGKNAITQKLVQTGCQGIAEDILEHRRLMQIKPLKEDTDGTTCPFVFKHPASPHLAAEMEGEKIDIEKIDESTKQLQNSFDIVLLEGAGGLYVPIIPDYRIIDFIVDHKYPLILTSSSKLGSINHTLLSIEACLSKGIELVAVAYNHFPALDSNILADSRHIIQSFLKEAYPKSMFFDIPMLNPKQNKTLELGGFLS